jgi:hypothetical protein
MPKVAESPTKYIKVAFPNMTYDMLSQAALADTKQRTTQTSQCQPGQ